MKIDAVLFDCDGVLVDSEAITNTVLRDMLDDLGWKNLTEDECMRIFLGRTIRSEAARIEAATGKPLTEEWLASFRARRDEMLERHVTAIDGALEAVETIHAMFDGRIACASGADRKKVELQLAKCGFLRYFEGRIFSGHELPRSKPAPDVYLAAANALGRDPTKCAVVEDTVVGVTAGAAAGATVFGYSPHEAGHDTPNALRDAGARVIFTRMGDLPALVER